MAQSSPWALARQAATRTAWLTGGCALGMFVGSPSWPGLAFIAWAGFIAVAAAGIVDTLRGGAA